MKRLRRWLFNLAAGVSVLLFVATAALWARTFWRKDVFQFADRRNCLWTSPHRLWWTSTSLPDRVRSPFQSHPTDDRFGQQFSWGFRSPTFPASVQARSFAFLGLAYLSFIEAQPAPPRRFTFIGVPMWCLLLATMLAPATWILRRARRRTVGHCDTCGYDLRATPDRCPECGAVPEGVKGAAT